MLTVMLNLKSSMACMSYPAANFQKLHRIAIDLGVLLLPIPPDMEQPAWGELLGVCFSCHGSFRHLLQSFMQLLDLGISEGVGLELGVQLGLVEHLVGDPVAHSSREGLQGGTDKLYNDSRGGQGARGVGQGEGGCTV